MAIRATSGGDQLPVVISNASQADAFRRLRVSDPTTLFDAQFQYGLMPLLWESVLTGGGTAVHLPNESSVRMRVATIGDKVVRQSHGYLRYQPGKSQMVVLTGVMGAITANTRQRIGYFDANNGIFFEQDGSNLKAVQRSSVTGSPIDNPVAQSGWNLDTLDGTGPSGLKINMADAQIFIYDLQWLGVGRVRLGFSIGGEWIYAHEFRNANSLTTAYMTTANLPVRYELEATGAIAGNVDLRQICSAVISEGGFEFVPGLLFTANNGVSVIGVTTRRPVLSIRPKTTLNSITNRGQVVPLDVNISASTQAALIELVLNGTLTGASFASVDSNSLTEADTSATAISGGTIVASFYATTQGGAARGNAMQPLIDRIHFLTLDSAGSVPDVMSVVATAVNSTSNILASLNWREIY